MTGRVEGIFITPDRGSMPEPVESVRALAGRGPEAVEAMEREHGISLEARATRRNVVTRGVDVNDLVGKRFRVGAVECEGVELCEPCAHLESMTKPGIIKGLVHRGGLNADILSDGEISVGDAVVLQD
jgi:MOSC domain-containing protein YiiM